MLCNHCNAGTFELGIVSTDDPCVDCGRHQGENGTVNNPNQALDNLILRTVELKRSLEKERQAQRELLQKVRLQELTKAEFEKLLKLQGLGRPDGGESIADRELRALLQDTPTGEGDRKS